MILLKEGGRLDGIEGRLSFSVFSENMQRKALQTTKVTQTSMFPKFPFLKMATFAVHLERAHSRIYWARRERDRQQERLSFPQRLLVFFFPLLMGFKMHITEGKVQGLEKDMRPEREAQRF